MTTRTELRRLLHEATPTPWEVGSDGVSIREEDACTILPVVPAAEARLIVAAVNAVPGLLDEVERLKAEVDNLRDALVRQMELRLVDAVRIGDTRGKLAVVRKLHRRVTRWQYDERGCYTSPEHAADDSGCDCPDDDNGDMDHTANCLAQMTSFDICAECAEVERADADRQGHGEFSGYDVALWPCSTVRALDGEADR